MTFDDLLENTLRSLAARMRGIVGDEFVLDFTQSGDLNLTAGEDLATVLIDDEIEDVVNDAVEEIDETADRLGHESPISITLSSRGDTGYTVTYGGTIESPVTLPESPSETL